MPISFGRNVLGEAFWAKVLGETLWAVFFLEPQFESGAGCWAGLGRLGWAGRLAGLSAFWAELEWGLGWAGWVGAGLGLGCAGLAGLCWAAGR